MKKTLFLLGFIISSLISFSQSKPPVVPRSSPALTVQDARFKAQLNFYVPVVNDTTSGLNGGLDSLGALIQIRTTGDLYKRDTVISGGHKWTLLGSDGGSSSGSTSNSDTVTQTSHGFTLGKVVSRSASGWVLADTISNFANGVVSAVIDANTFVVTTSGTFAWTSGLTIGAIQYSSTTVGGMTSTSPVISIPVGTQVSTTRFLVGFPSRPVDFSGAASSFDSLATQGGGFHTQPYNDARYVNNADSGIGYSTTTALNDTAYQRDPYSWQMSIVSPLLDSTTVGYRQDGPSIIRAANGTVLAVWSAFPTTGVADNSPCNIVGSMSTDNGKTWSTPSIKANGSISNMGHISTPSLWLQSNGNIILMANVKNIYSTVPSPGIGTNIYRYKSTDNGATFVLQDSLISTVTRYGGVTNNRIVKAQASGRLFMPYLEATTVSPHYQVGCFYSDNDGNSWNLFSWRIAQPDTSADEPGVFVLQNSAPVDTAGGAEKVYFYWTNSGPVLYAYSQDNGATVHGNYSLGMMSTETVLSLASFNNETQVVGLINRQMVHCCNTQGGQRRFTDLIYSNDIVNWRFVANMAGYEAGYHYFEHAITWDSAHGSFMIMTSRMNDAQTRSEIRSYKIPTRTAIASTPIFNSPIGSIGIGVDQATSANSWPGLIIYNRDKDNIATNGPMAMSGFTAFRSASGSSCWPNPVFRASTDGPLAALLEGWVGNDLNSQYYSSAFSFIGHPHAGTGALVHIPIAKFINNTTPVFIIGPTGDTEIADSVQLDKVRDGTTSDSVAVLKQIATGKFIIHKVAQSSIGIANPMTNTQRDAIPSPAEGLTIYSLTDHVLEFYNGSAWKQVTTN